MTRPNCKSKTKSFLAGFFKKNGYIHFCKTWHSFIWTHTLMYIGLFIYVFSSYFLQDKCSKWTSTWSLFSLCSLPYEVLLLEKKNTPTCMRSYPRIKIVPSKSQAVLNLSSIIKFFYTDNIFKSFTSNVECFRFILEKKQGGGRFQIDPT